MAFGFAVHLLQAMTSATLELEAAQLEPVDALLRKDVAPALDI